jgi:hypothetical protein
MLRRLAQFSTTLPADSDGSKADGEVIGGRNVAEAVRLILEGLGCACKPVEDLGDHGWGFHFKYAGRRLFVEMLPVFGIFAQFEDTTFFPFRLPPHRRFVEVLCSLSEAMSADPRISHLGWFSEKENLDEVVGAATPTAAVYSKEPCERFFGAVEPEI